jgi:hypothetical protein
MVNDKLMPHRRGPEKIRITINVKIAGKTPKRNGFDRGCFDNRGANHELARTEFGVRPAVADSMKGGETTRSGPLFGGNEPPQGRKRTPY